MESIVNMIINDENASNITDKIKEVLYLKSAENIEAMAPYVANSIFGDNFYEDEDS